VGLHGWPWAHLPVPMRAHANPCTCLPRLHHVVVGLYQGVCHNYIPIVAHSLIKSNSCAGCKPVHLLAPVPPSECWWLLARAWVMAEIWHVGNLNSPSQTQGQCKAPVACFCVLGTSLKPMASRPREKCTASAMTLKIHTLAVAHKSMPVCMSSCRRIVCAQTQAVPCWLTLPCKHGPMQCPCPLFRPQGTVRQRLEHVGQ
jgi:hypothetical protein